MTSPSVSNPPTPPDGPVNDNSLPIRDPKLFASNDGTVSGSGTPIGFQRYPHNHFVEGVGRQPSPQSTHLGIPGGGLHRVLSEKDPGYIAAKFEGKQKQMEQGISLSLSLAPRHLITYH